MKKFIIARKLPGAGNMTPDELRTISKTSVDVVSSLNKPYTWVESFVTDDAIYCIHEAESEDSIREHSTACRFPINGVEEVRVVIGPQTAL
ncbi:MAG: DUF4242 domain-containing protein [Chitinophagaceae bacterium]|nr:DUF4242 domain-containing protein [Chitinophagaceae bacterium]